MQRGGNACYPARLAGPPVIVDFIYSVPTWVIGIAIMVISVGGSLCGLLLFHHFVPVAVRRAHNDVAGFIIAVVGVIYAVLLAFLAIAVWEDFNAAETIVQNEASLAGDIFIDAASSSDAACATVRKGMRDYVELVVHDEWPALARGETSTKAVGALVDVQKAVVGAVDHGPVFQEILSRLNSLYDARRARLTKAGQGLQPIAWMVVIVGAMFTIGFSFLFGVPDLRLHMAMVAVLAASIALVIILIIAFDYPFRGDAKLSPEPFVHVHDFMQWISENAPR